MDVSAIHHSFILVTILILGLPFIKAIAVVIAGKIAGSSSASYFKPVGLYYLIAVIIIGFLFATGITLQLKGLSVWLFEIIISVIIAVALFNSYNLVSGRQKLCFTVACVILNIVVTLTIYYLFFYLFVGLMQVIMSPA